MVICFQLRVHLVMPVFGFAFSFCVLHLEPGPVPPITQSPLTPDMHTDKPCISVPMASPHKTSAKAGLPAAKSRGRGQATVPKARNIRHQTGAVPKSDQAKGAPGRPLTPTRGPSLKKIGRSTAVKQDGHQSPLSRSGTFRVSKSADRGKGSPSGTGAGSAGTGSGTGRSAVTGSGQDQSQGQSQTDKNAGRH